MVVPTSGQEQSLSHHHHHHRSSSSSLFIIIIIIIIIIIVQSKAQQLPIESGRSGSLGSDNRDPLECGWVTQTSTPKT